MEINKLITKLQKDTNNNSDITYRTKYINKQKIIIIYCDSLVSDDKISDFIIRSLDQIDNKYQNTIELSSVLQNDLNNFKIKIINSYKDMCFYLYSGYTIILIENNQNILALETKKNLFRSINNPQTENSSRGPLDCFIENIENNLGLIKRRIKDNNLWIKDYNLGKYTKTKTSIIYLNKLIDKKILKNLDHTLKKLQISGILDSGEIKNLLQKENKDVFPTIMTTERPDVVCNALLEGKIIILVDNSPYALIIPSVLNDFFKAPDDNYGKSINVTVTRTLRYISFFISLFTPALYIAITTFNQEMLPTELIINFAAQRQSVPLPSFFEAIVMIIAFEILRESDLRKANYASNALSIAGALILGEAAVNAGVVSPIMIIVIAITAICALPFSEPELTNGLRLYRFIFMIGASLLGIIGVIMAFIIFLVKLSSLTSFSLPYLYPYAPTNYQKLKNSIIRFPINKIRRKQ